METGTPPLLDARSWIHGFLGTCDDLKITCDQVCRGNPVWRRNGGAPFGRNFPCRTTPTAAGDSGDSRRRLSNLCSESWSKCVETAGFMEKGSQWPSLNRWQYVALEIATSRGSAA